MLESAQPSDNQLIDFLPTPVQNWVYQNLGSPIKADALSGLTGASVWRIHSAAKSVIVKRTDHANEVFFYQQIAPTLNSHNVPTPHLHFVEEKADTFCLILEDIPEPFPNSRWLADAEQLQYLRRLHSVNATVWQTETILFRPQWTTKMTEAALTWFPSIEANAIKPQLETWCQAAQSVFQPNCLISGDPNPLNWGCRRDGTLVQFDWGAFWLGNACH